MKAGGRVERTIVAVFGGLTMPQFGRVMRLTVMGSIFAALVGVAAYFGERDWWLLLLVGQCVLSLWWVEHSWSDADTNMRIAKRWAEEDGSDEFTVMLLLSILDRFPIRDCRVFMDWLAGLDGADPFVAIEHAPEPCRRIFAATKPPEEPQWWDR